MQQDLTDSYGALYIHTVKENIEEKAREGKEKREVDERGRGKHVRCSGMGRKQNILRTVASLEIHKQ